jgi:hypothetical protein
MSWLLGSRYKQPAAPQDDGGHGAEGAGTPGQQQQGGPPGGSDKRSTMDAYRFDSGALERAAQAAKELERSGTKPFFSIRTFHHCQINDVWRRFESFYTFMTNLVYLQMLYTLFYKVICKFLFTNFVYSIYKLHILY